MVLDYTNKRMRLMSSIAGPAVFWMVVLSIAMVNSQYSSAYYHPTTQRYAGGYYGQHQLPVSYPAGHSNQYHANPAQYDRHGRFYDSSNTRPCSNYFCSRLDFALLSSVIRPEDRPVENCTAVGPCATGQVFVCAADPVVSFSYGHYNSYGYSAPGYATATPSCPAFVCNANFTAIVTGCDPMNCTIIGSTPLMF